MVIDKNYCNRLKAYPELLDNRRRLMKDIDWNKLTEELCGIEGCSTEQLVECNNHDTLKHIKRKRNAILKAADVVRKTYEQYPDLSKDQFRKKVYANLFGSILLVLILQAFTSVALKMAIEWFIDQIFS